MAATAAATGATASDTKSPGAGRRDSEDAARRIGACRGWGAGLEQAPASAQAAHSTRAVRAVRVIVGHVCPVLLRLELDAEGGDGSPREGDETGAKIWPSSLVLSDWLARQPEPGPYM